MMAYSNNDTIEKCSIIIKLKTKLGKLLAKSFPLNSVRIVGLKLCGFTIGSKVYIGEDLIITSILSDPSCALTIGDRVAVGPRVTLLLSSDANWSKLMDKLEYINKPIVLNDDCWIGAGVIILPGVVIGKSSIVGAGAVVTKDVDDNAVVVGVPANSLKTCLNNISE